MPIASASIGQVHRAVVVDPDTGLERAVAVKVQYPGVGAAIEADLRNASLLGAILKQGFGGLDPDDMVAEIKERLIDELDYQLEATNQQAFADYYRGHPFIHVPDVLASHSTSTGADQRAGQRGDVAGDDRSGRRTSATSPASACSASCSAACTACIASTAIRIPGNYLFHGGGRVTFLDFGLVKQFTDERDGDVRRHGQVRGLRARRARRSGESSKTPACCAAARPPTTTRSASTSASSTRASRTTRS